MKFSLSLLLYFMIAHSFFCRLFLSHLWMKYFSCFQFSFPSLVAFTLIFVFFFVAVFHKLFHTITHHCQFEKKTTKKKNEKQQFIIGVNLCDSFCSNLVWIFSSDYDDINFGKRSKLSLWSTQRLKNWVDKMMLFCFWY